MSDTSTDVTTIDKEIVYVRVTINQMLFLVSVESANATGIVKSIDDAFGNLRSSPEEVRKKIVSLATDGASVMVGRHAGVAAMLKQDVPHLVSIHCVAHRLGLAILDAIKDKPCLQEIKRVLPGNLPLLQ